MNLRTERSPAADLNRLARAPHDGEGPVFSAPWEAQAFAIAVQLSKAGHFTWGRWVETFSKALPTFEARGVYDPADDDGRHYYEVWLATLEQLVFETGMLDERVVTARHQHLIDHPVPHAHQAKREPICIS